MAQGCSESCGRGRCLRFKPQSQRCSPQLELTEPLPPGGPTPALRALFPGGLPKTPPTEALPTATETPAARRGGRPRPFNGHSPPFPDTELLLASRPRHLPQPPAAPAFPQPHKRPAPPAPRAPTSPHQAPGGGWGNPARPGCLCPRQSPPPAPSLPVGCLPGPPGQLSSSQRCSTTPTAQGHSSTSQFRIGRRRSQPLPLRAGLSGPTRPPATPPHAAAAARPSRAPLPRGRRELQSRPSPGGQRRRGRRRRPPTAPTMPRGGAPRPREAVASGAGSAAHGEKSRAGALPRGEMPRKGGFTSRFTWRGSVDAAGSHGTSPL